MEYLVTTKLELTAKFYLFVTEYFFSFQIFYFCFVTDSETEQKTCVLQWSCRAKIENCNELNQRQLGSIHYYILKVGIFFFSFAL